MIWPPIFAIATTAFLLIVAQRPILLIALLAAQYAAVAWMSSFALPPQVAAVKLVAGLIACGVLALTVASGPRAVSAPFGRPFRILSAILILTAAVGLGRTNWLGIPDIRQEAIMGATILLAMGLLQLGLFGSSLRVGIGLMTLLSGFEIAHSVIEPALAVLALLASVNIGFATVVSYLMLVAGQVAYPEGPE